ncbi:putative glycosyltransferase [Desulfocapsa sulfexigens DSM 10523]|uniref:Putative glycosyltransferase n=2 Tax=Desulfocapsa TaxID=53318 RepID=M1PK32_DESSD|nr:putative glycosyltransferase [Desulfocapsa sulfexigens DSM 10523]
MLLSILVISYNTCELTLKALDSVFAVDSVHLPFEVIVLDNNSTDNSAEEIHNAFQGRVHLITNKENIGFAGGNNEAAKVATGEYLLLLNPDTLVLDQAIEKLLSFAKDHSEAKIWGGKTCFADGTLNPSSCWQRQTLWSLFSQVVGLSSLFRRTNIFNPEGIGGWNREGIRTVDIVSGCFLLIKRDFWNEMGGFNSDFFMYGEEADLCLRAKRKGARPMVTSDATIVHYGGASETIRSDKLVRLVKAKGLLIRRHFSPVTVPLGVAMLAGWPLSRYLIHGLLTFLGKKKSEESKEVWGAVWRRRKEWLS